MLPVVCRRGDVKGTDVGAIRIGRLWSTVEIAEDAASAFETICSPGTASSTAARSCSAV